MKRFILFIQILMLAVLIIGCGTTTSEEGSATAETTTSEEGSATAETTVEDDSTAENEPESEETMSVHIPEPGEDLAEAMDNEHLRNLAEDPPVKVEIYIDHGGPAETAELTDSEDIAEFIRLFSEIRIEGETNEVVTDNYNWFSLTFSDDETVSFSLNLENLEFSADGEYHIFTLSDFDDLWSYMNEVAEFPEE